MNPTWRLTDRELYLLCEFAERPWPALFDEPPTATDDLGHHDDNRRIADDLVARGLADGRGPLGPAADLVHALRDGRRAHLVVGGATPVRATVLHTATDAFVLLDDPPDDDGISVLPTSADVLPELLVNLVPDVPAADSTPLAFPRAALTEARAHDSEFAVQQALRDHGVDHATQRRWTTALHPVVSDGQFGHDPTDEVRWVDTPRGRFRLAGDDGWISANPLGSRAMLGLFRQVTA